MGNFSNSKKQTGKAKSKINSSLAVGGQAIIEGVMMRNKDLVASAVRNKNGKIVIKKDKFISITNKIKFLGWPFIRGMVNLIEIMILGMKIMIWSSNQNLGEEENFSFWELFFTLAFAIIFSIVLFKLLPLFLTTKFQFFTKDNNFLFNLIDGILKSSLLVGYLFIISRMSDVKRLFGYHGAEHKSINCYENRLPLTVKNVLSQSRFHPRCGTTFIVFVFFVSIFVYMIIPISASFFTKLVLRLLLLPLIAGISYEIIKFSGNHQNNFLVKIITFPGMFVQRLTTREPDGTQAEVAIASLKSVVKNAK